MELEEEAFSHSESDPRLVAMRQRIGWLGATIDGGSVLLIAGMLVQEISALPEATRTLTAFLQTFAVDPQLVTTSVLAELFFVRLISTVIMALQLLAISRLVHGYLDGDVFSLRAVARLRRIAIVGYWGAGFDFIARPLLGLVTSPSIFGKLPIVTWFNPDTLSLVLFSTLLLALAAIFKTALVFAREHAEFV